MSYKFIKQHNKIRIVLTFGITIAMLLTQVVPLQYLGIPFGVQDAKAVIAYEQEGFRFRDDNGSETTATWLANQDTNITRDINLNTRLRMLVNTTDDSPSNQYQLEYKKSTDGTYKRVIPNVTVPTIQSTSSAAYANNTSWTHPHTTYTGQQLVVMVHALRDAETVYTLSATFNGDAMTSAGSTWGTTFSRGYWTGYRTEIFYLTNPDVGTFDVVVTPSIGTTRAVISAHSLIGFSGTIGDTSTAWDACSVSVDTVQANSLILTASSVRSNTTPPTITEVGSNVELYETNTAAADTGIVGAGYSLVTTTTGAYTGGGTCSATLGDHVFAAEFRFDTTQQPIYLSLSSNIASSGANTTFQLTAPSGKSTSDFVTGRIQDDENPADAINITINDYTELEWSLIATSAAADGDIYQFRVTVAGTALDTYSVTPQWTIPTPVLTQNDWRLYVNNDAIDPTEPWADGSAIDLAENEALSSMPPQNDPLDTGDVIRLRMNITVTQKTLNASTEGFILAYAEATDCTAVSSWTDVDALAGGGVWRFYNSSVTDGATITTLKLTNSDVAGRVSESDPTSTNPNVVTAGQDLEWDWVVEYNGAAEAHSYCFRMERDDGSALDAYNSDSYPRIETRPGVNDFMRHGNFYSTYIEKGFFWVEVPEVAGSPEVAAKGTVYNTNDIATTSHVVDLPDGITSGDLLLVFMAIDGTASATWPGGWTRFVDADADAGASHHIEVAYRIANGSDGTSVTVTTASEQATAFSWLVTDWHGTSAPEATTSTGTSTTPDSPSLSPSWGSANTLWISFYGVNGGPDTGNVIYPTNYSDNQQEAETGGGGAAGGSIASRTLTAASEDPGSFTDTNGLGWSAATIGVRPQ